MKLEPKMRTLISPKVILLTVVFIFANTSICAQDDPTFGSSGGAKSMPRFIHPAAKSNQILVRKVGHPSALTTAGTCRNRPLVAYSNDVWFDGKLYISNWSFGPPFGEILQVTLN